MAPLTFLLSGTDAMLRCVKLQPKTLIHHSSLFLTDFCFSSSSTPPPPDQDSSAAADCTPPDHTDTGGSSPPSPPSYSSIFSDIKERLKSPSTPPRRIPTNPPPPTAFSASKQASPASLEEIRKHLAEFRLKPGGPTSVDRPSSPPFSFQDILKNNAFGKPGLSADSTGTNARKELSFDSIRESLKKYRAPPQESEGRPRSFGFNIRDFQDGLREGFREGGRLPQLIGTDKLPDSIFGKEKIEKKREGEDGAPKVSRTDFVKMYSYEELGHKLQKLRPEKEGKKGEWFSLSELNERLAKLRELEEKETESRLGGVSFKDLRESLQKLKDADASKRENCEFLFYLCCPSDLLQSDNLLFVLQVQRFSIFSNMGIQGTPAFMLKPPQEHLLENVSSD